MKIGALDLGPQPVLLAPMEDVTDIGFRLLCRQMSAVMVYTEFVSSDALVRNVNRTIQKLQVCPEERPVAIQIYGKYPDAMAEAARMVVDMAHPDVLDLNFGCPVKRVASKGAGAGLLRDIPLMLDITRRVVDAVDIPVTAKTRLGWDHNNIIIGDLAEQLQDQGIQALTIHGRTRSQMYTGQADWEPIAQVKRNPRIHIPIIGNGDISSADDAARAFDSYGVDAIMIGRATFGRPWIFKEIHDTLHPDSPIDTAGIINSPYEPMSPDWKLDVLKLQVRTIIIHVSAKKKYADDSGEGERCGILHSRRHIANSPLFKGIPNFREHRIAMLRAETADELFRLMEEARPLIR